MTREEAKGAVNNLIDSNYNARNPSYPELIAFQPRKFLNELLPLLDRLGVVLKGQSLGFSHPHLADYYTVESLIDV